MILSHTIIYFSWSAIQLASLRLARRPKSYREINRGFTQLILSQKQCQIQIEKKWPPVHCLHYIHRIRSLYLLVPSIQKHFIPSHLEAVKQLVRKKCLHIGDHVKKIETLRFFLKYAQLEDCRRSLKNQIKITIYKSEDKIE